MSEEAGLPRILIAGDAAVPTGFARVMEGIFRPLSRSYEIHHLGTNYHGDPHPYDWAVYPAEIGGDRWGARRVAPLVERLRPQLLFILNDIWVQHAYMEELKSIEDLPPVVLYCPVDGGPLDAETIAPLRRISRFVVYTEFGRRQVEAAVAGQRAREPAFDFPSVEVIPHGVDTETFHPLEEGRGHARRLLFPDAPDVDERFIVLNANRNQPRKRIDTTIRGFALFARDKPASVKLFLHMGVEDAGWNVIQLARRYGVEDRVLMSSLGRVIQGVSAKQLNLVYNACDVGLNTSSAEGAIQLRARGHARGADRPAPQRLRGAMARLGAAARPGAERRQRQDPHRGLARLARVGSRGARAPVPRPAAARGDVGARVPQRDPAGLPLGDDLRPVGRAVPGGARRG